MATQIVQNPFTQANAGQRWDSITFSGYGQSIDVPGFVEDINGCDREALWLIQKAPNTNYAVTVFRGWLLCEDIPIRIRLPDRQSVDDYMQAARVLSTQFAKGASPDGFSPAATVFNITSPPLNFAGITRVGIRMCGTPRVAPGLSWTAIIRLVEYRPPRKVRVGPPDPPRQGETRNEKLAKENEALADAARKGPSLF
jgi:hypothetical protein